MDVCICVWVCRSSEGDQRERVGVNINNEGLRCQRKSEGRKEDG